MNRVVWADFRALLRSARFAASVPWIIAGANRQAAEFSREFDCSVRPLLDESILDPALRARLAGTLATYAMRSGFVVAGYARMTGVPFAGDLAVLGLSFTRLYDDLLDEVGGPDLEQRMTALIEDRPFTPCSDLERLLHRLYREIDRRAGRGRDDPLYAAVRAAHGFQIRSRRQRDPRTSVAALLEISRGKGAYGTLTVFALMRPALPPRERALIMEVGMAVQMLDDYADIEADRQAGIRTPATEGRQQLADVGAALRAARPRLAGYYGPARIREFLGICYLAMWITFVQRRLPRLRAHLSPVVAGPAIPAPPPPNARPIPIG
jgi:hypothetical protein